MRCAVSLESLPVPARAAVIKSLQARLGLALLPEDDRCGGPVAPLALLLHRLRALAKQQAAPGGGHALWGGPWLPSAPRDPLLRRLHRDLGAAVAARLMPDAGVRHLMVCLESCPDEAFEALVGVETGRSKDVSLQSLHQAQRAIHEAAAGGGSCSPFPVEIVRVACPCFAADNPETLARVLDLACAACHCLKAAPPANTPHLT